MHSGTAAGNAFRDTLGLSATFETKLALLTSLDHQLSFDGSELQPLGFVPIVVGHGSPTVPLGGRMARGTLQALPAAAYNATVGANRKCIFSQTPPTRGAAAGRRAAKPVRAGNRASAT